MHPPFQFDAFICYRRGDGATHAKALRRMLLAYRFPKGFAHGLGAEKPTIFLDTIYERADEDFFENSIAPALKRSARLIVVRTPSASEPRTGGARNWVVREVELFRTLPQGQSISAAFAGGELGAPLPAGLDTDFPNIQRVDISRLAGWHRLWPPSRVRAADDVLPLISTVYRVDPARMPALRREEARRAAKRLAAWLVATSLVTLLIAGLLAWALASRVQAAQAQHGTVVALAEARQRLADSLAVMAEAARARGDSLAALRFASESRATALTARSTAAALSIGTPTLLFDRDLVDGVLPAAFQTREKRLVLGTVSGALSIFDLGASNSSSSIEISTHPVVSLSFSRDGRRLFAIALSQPDAGWNGFGEAPTSELIVLDTSSRDFEVIGRVVRSNAREALLVVASVHDGSRALVGTRHGAAIYDVDGGSMSALPVEPAQGRTECTSVQLSPDGRRAAGSTPFGRLWVWDLPSGRLHAEHAPAFPSGAFPYLRFDPVFAPDGNSVWLGGFDGILRNWDLSNASAPRATRWRHAGAVGPLARTSDGRLVAGSSVGTVHVWQPQADRPLAGLAAPESSFPSIVQSVAVSDDDRFLVKVTSPAMAAGGDGGRWMFGHAELWRLFPPDGVPADPMAPPLLGAEYDESGRLSIWRLDDQLELEWQRDGELLRMGGFSGAPFTSSVATQLERRPVRSLTLGQQSSDGLGVQSRSWSDGTELQTASDLSPDGEALVMLSGTVRNTAFASGKVRLIRRDSTTLEHELVFPPHVSAVGLGPVELSHDGASIVFAVVDEGGVQRSIVYAWQLDQPEPRVLASWPENAVTSMSLSPDGRYFALGSRDGPVCVCEITARHCEFRWEALRIGPSLVKFSRDGQWLVVAAGSFLRVVDASGSFGQERIAPVPLGFAPTALDTSADALMFVTAEESGRVEFWSLPEPSSLASAEIHAAPIAGLSLSPDDRRLMTFAADGIRYWGSHVPDEPLAAERITRLKLEAGSARAGIRPQTWQRFANLDDIRLPRTADAAAARFWRIFHDTRRAPEDVSTWTWLTGDPMAPAPELDHWAAENADHPLEHLLVDLMANHRRSGAPVNLDGSSAMPRK